MDKANAPIRARKNSGLSLRNQALTLALDQIGNARVVLCSDWLVLLR